jgi:hypothetical protein
MDTATSNTIVQNHHHNHTLNPNNNINTKDSNASFSWGGVVPADLFPDDSEVLGDESVSVIKMLRGDLNIACCALTLRWQPLMLTFFNFTLNRRNGETLPGYGAVKLPWKTPITTIVLVTTRITITTTLIARNNSSNNNNFFLIIMAQQVIQVVATFGLLLEHPPGIESGGAPVAIRPHMR